MESAMKNCESSISRALPRYRVAHCNKEGALQQQDGMRHHTQEIPAYGMVEPALRFDMKTNKVSVPSN